MRKVLLTGANGYIGKRLLPVLLQQYQVVCCVRDKTRFDFDNKEHPNCEIIELDFLKKETLTKIPKDIEGAFFLMHSMSSGSGDFSSKEKAIAENFVEALESTDIEHVVYLGAITNDRVTSKHISSRKQVEDILGKGKFSLTTLGAGIILGSGSSSFEIMRDLVEKLPFMIAPKWLLTTTQPIAVQNVIEFLSRVLFYKKAYDQKYDISGPEVMTYREMLLRFAKVRGLKCFILQVPVMTPALSSYWLYFITSVPFSLAKSLVGSMKVQIIARKNNLHKELGIELIPFTKAIEDAFSRIEQSTVISSWKDSIVSGRLKKQIKHYIQVPVYGCFKDVRKQKINNPEVVMKRIWNIGGKNGWYYGNWLWEVRGFLDKLVGGVGLRRGRTNAHKIKSGDALDFWRVILADKKNKRLLLYAEMKLPGEAWLEFKIENKVLIQTATFRPRGIFGRIYWWVVHPLHVLIFGGMIKKLAEKTSPAS